MEIVVYVAAGIGLVVGLMVLVTGINKSKAREAFIRGYEAGSLEELSQVIDRHAYPAFTSFNVTAALLGRILAKEAPMLDRTSVIVGFNQSWNDKSSLMRAQSLDAQVSTLGKEATVAGLKDSLRELY